MPWSSRHVFKSDGKLSYVSDALSAVGVSRGGTRVLGGYARLAAIDQATGNPWPFASPAEALKGVRDTMTSRSVTETS